MGQMWLNIVGFYIAFDIFLHPTPALFALYKNYFTSQCHCSAVTFLSLWTSEVKIFSGLASRDPFK